VISDETPFALEACKIGDVRYKVFRFQVSTDQKVGGSSPSKLAKSKAFFPESIFSFLGSKETRGVND